MGIGYRQCIKIVNFNIDNMLRTFTNLLNSMLNREQRILIGVASHCNHDPVKKPSGSLDDVEMTKGDWIKATRINGNHDLGDTCSKL